VGGRYFEFNTNRDYLFGCLNADGPSDPFGSNQDGVGECSVDPDTDRPPRTDGGHPPDASDGHYRAAVDHESSELTEVTSDPGRERVSVRLDDALLAALEAAVERGKYPSMSAAVRGALRDRLEVEDDA